MNAFKIISLSVATSAIVAFSVMQLSRGADTRSEPKKTTYEKMVERGTLECGYIPYPPMFIKDPNTGELSGIFHEAVEKSASNLGLEVVWKEEVEWGTMITALRAGRFDAICSPVWSNSARWAKVDFSTPLFFSGVTAYARGDDQRFEQSVDVANNSEFTIATIDGDSSMAIANQLFPEANLLELPQLSDYSQILLAVEEGKADLTFAEPFYAIKFNEANGADLTKAGEGSPIRIFGNSMMFRKGDTQIKSTLDGALNELIYDGSVDKLVEKYTGSVNSYYSVSTAYKQAE